MTTETPLYSWDYVILKSDGEFLKHDNGRIVIYNDPIIASKDFAKLPNSKVCNCNTLTSKNRKILRKNIREYGDKKG